MGLDELQPGNTKRAKATAVKAFGRFLDAEEVSLEYVKICIERDVKGQTFVSVMDKFAMRVRLVTTKIIFAVSSMVPLRANVFFCGEEQECRPPLQRLRHVSIARDCNGAYDAGRSVAQISSTICLSSRSSCAFARANTPLLEILDNGDSYNTSSQPPNTDAADITPTIHSHQLTSHSFRRGSAQHANGSADLTVCWIFDRGAWNMSTTNKGFSYVFNTTKEDHKVSKVLSGWHVDDSISLLDLTRFDTQTQDRIKNVQNRLYTTCKGLGTTRFNVNQRVLDVLTAYLIRHFPLLKEVNPEGPVIKRLETCVMESDCTVADLLSWSTHLVAIPSSCTKEEIKSCKSSKQVLKITEESSIIRHQASVIDHFIQHVKRQDARMDALEAKLNGAHSPRKEKRQQEHPVASEPKKRKTHQAVTHLKTTWFSWYAHEPRMWSAQGDKQKKSDAKLLVAFMKLFLEDGFALDSQAPNYRDLVLELGSKAESSVLEFLRARGISSKGSNAVLKHLRVLHRSGALNDKIAHHRKLLAARKILDPAPGFTQDVLELVVFSQQSDSGYRSLSIRVNQCLAPHKCWLRRVALCAPLIVLILIFATSCNVISNNNNKMKPPTKNNISSRAEFKGLCVMYANSAGVRIRDQALRHLRTTLNAASSHSNDLHEALYVIFLSLAKRGTRMIELEHLREWIAPPADATDANDDAEWTAEGSLAGEQLHSVRKVLDCVKEGKKTYYLVDWAPTYEPRENLPQSLIIQFNKERRALVRRTYIEYEASEDNSENPQ
ncbi:hypothetical protein FI667_g16368, partial [Globisporangium splendens]